MAATSPGSTHPIVTNNLPGDLIAYPDEAKQFIANRIGNGSNYIKLIAEANGMTQAEHNATPSLPPRRAPVDSSPKHAVSLYAWMQAIMSGTT